MEKRDYRRNAGAMIYLVSCALQNRVPDAEKLKQIRLDALFEVCQDHVLTACAAYALESAGICDKQFKEAKEKAIRKNVLLDAERAKILRRMEQEKIWYMPLKGALLHSWYPKLGMRQMSDNDILCDSSKMKQVREIFLDEGYTCEKFGREKDDVYFKQPVLNFEMHRSLFGNAFSEQIRRYYEGVQARLIRNKDCEYGYSFTQEDFYLYMLAHEYSHFAFGGTGVRSLADTYVFLKKCGSSLDWSYIRRELRKLELADFEQQNRELAMKLFERKKLTDAEKKLLNFHIFSGAYGTTEIVVRHFYELFGTGSEIKYSLYRVFPPYSYVQKVVPWVKGRPLLLPAAWVYRFYRGLTSGRSNLLSEIRYTVRRICGRA